MNRVYLTTRLHGRVMKWDKESQIELDVFQGLVRSHGFEAVLGNSACAPDRVDRDSGVMVKIAFWMRIRVQYQPLTLEARAPGVFVIDI
jgi:hypothetical protein